MSPGTYAHLRDALPGVHLVQVIHVGGPESLDEALTFAPHVDALLLDSGNQPLAVKELDGTGRVHDWGPRSPAAPYSCVGASRRPCAAMVAGAMRGVAAGLDRARPLRLPVARSTGLCPRSHTTPAGAASRWSAQSTAISLSMVIPSARPNSDPVASSGRNAASSSE